MDVFSALSVAVAGVQAPSDAINTISQNISNADTIGYKEGLTTFADVLSDNSANNYSVNGDGAPDTGLSLSGVTATDNQLVDVQGNITPTSSPTDLAIAGPGFFAVTTTADNAGSNAGANLEYTRAGSFLPDANGNYANAAGLFLQAWPLSQTGALPAGITPGSINSATGIAALQTVNIQKIIATPVPTSSVSIQANLDSAQTVYPGPSDTAIMDSNDTTNYGISANTIIVPTATDSIAQGDTMIVSTGANPTGTTYTYGGIAFSRSIASTAVDGNSGLNLQQPVDLTPQSGAGTTTAFTFSATSPTTMTINLGANTPASVGVTQVGQIINLSGTGGAGGLNTDNISSLDGDYYVTGITTDPLGINSTITVTIPSNITPPSAMSLTGATFTSTNGSSTINVTGATLPAGLQTGDTLVFSNVPGIDGSITSGVLDNPNGYAVTVTGANSFSFTAINDTGVGGSSVGTANTTMFDTSGDLADTNTATVSSRLFTGNIMDAANPNQQMITSPTDFSLAALQFSITSGTVTSNFTYTALNPNTALGQFNSLNSLASAINNTASLNDSGLTAQVVNNQLYIADVNGNQDITFANGSATGTNTSPPLAGIDWIDELGLANIAAAPAGTERFSSLQGLANQINNTTGLSATVNNPLSASTLTISNTDPLDTISFADGATNTGSLLGELGLAPSLNGGPFVAQTAGPFGPSYNPAVSATNMASGAITPDFIIPLTVVDSDGTNHNLDASFLKTGTNSWSVEVYAQPTSAVVTADPNGQVATGTITFNSDGTLASVSPSLAQIGITWSDGAAPSSIGFNWGTAGALGVGLSNGVSQFASAYDIEGIQQNGIQANTSTSVSISSSGVISVSYSNGNTRPLYQIPLGEFQNPDQLADDAGNAYSPTEAAGTLTFLAPGANTGVSLDSQALESSNVDLATQLTNMIIAQNAYQANTKLITTSNQMLQTAVQMDQSISI